MDRSVRMAWQEGVQQGQARRPKLDFQFVLQDWSGQVQWQSHLHQHPRCRPYGALQPTRGICWHAQQMDRWRVACINELFLTSFLSDRHDNGSCLRLWNRIVFFSFSVLVLLLVLLGFHFVSAKQRLGINMEHREQAVRDQAQDYEPLLV